MKAGTLQLLAHKLWATRETKCLSIIDRALSLLREEEDLPEMEIELNRRLYFCLLAASRELYPDDEIAPVTECNNQPDPDDEARAKLNESDRTFSGFFWTVTNRTLRTAAGSSSSNASVLGNLPAPIGCSISTTAHTALRDSGTQIGHTRSSCRAVRWSATGKAWTKRTCFWR